jgi:hypothetical protein
MTFLTRAHVRPVTPTHVPLQPLFTKADGFENRPFYWFTKREFFLANPTKTHSHP